MTRYISVENKTNKVITERRQKHNITTALVLDLAKCRGCNLCWTVCPRYAIERGPIGASLRYLVDTPPIRVNYHKCVFCGLCAYICPFDALKLTINDKPAEKLKRGQVLPFLEGETLTCKASGQQALQFIEGEIQINDDLCPSGCSTCIDICPTECLSLPVSTKEEPWKKTRKIEVNRDECLYCGACIFACPAQGAIQLKRTKLNHSELGSDSRVWENIEKKLKKIIISRYWFFEPRVTTAPGGERKLAPKRKELLQQ